jgi:histidine ammonia-lyase
MSVALTGNDLTFRQLYSVALQSEPVSLAEDAKERMRGSRAVVDQLVADGQTAYGINTGVGTRAASACRFRRRKRAQ